MERSLVREIIFNPENDHFVPQLVPDGVNIFKDLTKIPTFNEICNVKDFANPMFYARENLNFTPNPDLTQPILENGKPAVVPNKIRVSPPPPLDSKKFYSLTSYIGLLEQVYDEDKLIDLAKSMIAVEGDIGENPSSQKSSSLPALFTYLGQFLDHDISGVNIPDFNQKIDVNTLVNTRTAILDLDSLFAYPAQYDSNGFLILEHNVNGVLDVPRSDLGIQIIGDIRNGENQIVLQTHMLFMKFYNRVLSELSSKGHREENMEKAKMITRYTWQWLLVHSYLRLATGPYYASLFGIDGEPNFDIITPDKFGALNAEWTFAFFRWHSLPQESYYPNGNDPVKERPLFSKTRKINFGGFKPLEDELVLDFGFFWNMDGYNGFQQTHRFGTTVSFPLGNLPNPVIPDDTVNLPERTLLRQNQVMMANGQDFARAFGIPNSKIIRKIKLQDPNFLPNEVLSNERIQELEEYFGNNTPLFYYILYEARELGNGEHLGPLGAKLFGQTLLAQLYSDPASYVYGNWFPINGKWGCSKTYEYSIEDFIRYANNQPYPEIPLFQPNLFTNFFDPERNIATSITVSKNFIQWSAKIVNTFGPNDKGKKLRLVNNLSISLSNLTIYIYNSSQTKLLETITMDFEDKYAELIWNGEGYVIGNLC